ncbi:MAG: hypothetical protein H6600_01965 [Flavobacteriales bacterium]|nr:hypothetical protein [Flavobacteriales bacterium]MCB9197196.1 hypothetical protein [Flavobacteriales bacterium]
MRSDNKYALSGISFLFSIFYIVCFIQFRNIVLPHISEWSFEKFSKFYIPQHNPNIEIIFVVIPTVLRYILGHKRVINVKELIIAQTVQVFVLLVFAIVGFILVLLISNPSGDSPLSPSYVISEPIRYYWAFFILPVPFITARFMSLYDKKKIETNELIDN